MSRARVKVRSVVPVLGAIYKADLHGAIIDNGWQATHRVLVILERDIKRRTFKCVFGAWEHFPKKCVCIDPGTRWSEPFGNWMRKRTHFAACATVHNIPFERIIERIGDQLVPAELFDAIDEVAAFADLRLMHRNIPKN